MTKKKSYVPVAARRRYCALGGCKNRLRLQAGVGRPTIWCSDDCRRKYETTRVVAAVRERRKREVEERALQPTQASLMRSRGYVTVAVAAQAIGRSKTAVYGWVERGLVASIRVGKAWYVSIPSLTEYLGPDGVAVLGDLLNVAK